MTTQQSMNMDTMREAIMCPITGDVMTDPVIGNDGHTYERSAIVEWLSRNPISPQTRGPMQISDLKVNPSIRFLCDKYHAGELGTINTTTRTLPKVSTDQIKLDHRVFKNLDNKVMLEFNINQESFPKNLDEGHLPQDIVLVIDRSGSMNAAVEAKDSDGKNLENGFAVQDIVNHTAKTVAKTLNSSSRLAVVVFDDRVETIMSLTPMTEMNKSTALSKISEIKPRNQTNIWGGYTTALNLLDERDDKSRNAAVLVFTDGSPNISPARGEVETLKKLRQKTNFTAPLYTFGFGYALQKDLLYDMAKYANGANGHIPDGGMMATVFCNFTATILSTVVLNLQLHIKSHKSGENNLMNLLMGDYPNNLDSHTGYTVFDLGTVQNEQTRNIILNTDSNSDFTYYYTYKIGGQSYKSEEIHVTNIRSMQDGGLDMDAHINRYFVVEDCRKMLNNNKIGASAETESLFTTLVSKLERSTSRDHPLTMGLLKNLKGDASNTGQIKLALCNLEYFRKWGEFYIDQLTRSMNQQVKPNFKDEGCPFGGPIFESIVERASDIFDTLPPPEPSLINKTRYSYGGSSAPAPTRAVTLAAYNDPNGGCFDSNCLITMADGTQKMLKNLVKGDMVQSSDLNNNISQTKVICILEMTMTSGKRDMVELENGILITPYHPIKYNNEWVFPVDIATPVERECKSVITLVLENNHIGFINGHQCIMLGHNYTDGILKHPYFGSELIINDLKNHMDWDKGYIVVEDGIKMERTNTLISKMDFSSIRAPATLVETW